MTIPNTLGNSAKLYYDVSGSGSYTEILNVKEITTPEPEYAFVSVSGLTDATELKALGFLDNKSFSFSVFQTDANFALFTSTLVNNMPHWKIVFSDTHTAIMQGGVKSVKSKADRNAAVMIEVVVELSGAVSYS